MQKVLLLIFIWFFWFCKGQTESKSNNTNEVASFEFLPEEVLKTKNKEELRLIRNEIFARKGHVFKSNDLNEYFKTKSWYKPDRDIKISLSNNEQLYIKKIKELEQKTEDKIHIDNLNCINSIDRNKSSIYPLTNEKLLSVEIEKLISNAENYHKYKFYEDIREYICEGKGSFIYNINCLMEIENILFVTYCGEDPTSHIFSIKGDKIINKVKVIDSSLREGEGSITSGFYDIDFKLNKDDLEVYKIFKIWDKENSTEENRYPTKEIRREVTKYKLTDQGLIAL
ncbi:YARHG domain-containing protein [Aquimarina longa]|uniref:YARHG domain-containing protein n=1 Tax=Aquimarina longa TaxID=1080221 RepID=UPI000785556D|nr:YARHG domain-containing protein [Aquimarina longa]